MGNIQMVGESKAPMYKGERPIETMLAPTRTLEDVANPAVDFWLSTEHLPKPGNRVTVSRDGKVALSYTPNNQVPAQKPYGYEDVEGGLNRMTLARFERIIRGSRMDLEFSAYYAVKVLPLAKAKEIPVVRGTVGCFRSAGILREPLVA